jgi:type II secretory pathway pseudopilin PulG
MKISSPWKRPAAGGSLIEAVVALGVLAVAFPLVFATLAGSSASGVSAQAETRSAWIVSACLEEIRASRDGRAKFLEAREAGQAFPGDGVVLALGFSADGRLLGRVAAGEYEQGVREVAGEPVRYLARLSGEVPAEPDAITPGQGLLRAAIVQEYPAAAPASERRKIPFYTRIR